MLFAENNNSVVSNRRTSRKMDLSEYVRHNELWYNDGSMVLLAEKHAFRVHIDILVQQSDVFADMFEIARDPPAFTTDNQPILELPEKWQDVLCALMFIYHARRYMQERMPFSVLRSLLHMGRKYNIEEMGYDAENYLYKRYPRTLAAHVNPPFHKTIDVEESADGVHSIAIVKLAREFDMPWILPLAFYECALLPLETLFSGTTDSTDTHWSLEEDDIRRVVKGREDLVMRRHKQLAVFVTPFQINLSEHCRTKDICREEIKEVGQAFYHEWETECRPAVLAPLQVRLNGFCMCEPCTKMYLDEYDGHRRDLWNALVRVFELQDELGETEWKGELEDDD
ncbi:hypothetical protein EIP91_004534 [Steccherinum ochraceum]|uniref:BTB domain-containing protein n=1 Tax=Steccherinum ochraceum TaxID=92696 RepID=A0A4R0R8P7_9APHY|nr:hypothetical protein EIP91_004534 [Steccherinum ochraceum]